jgi:hypothetical protein
VSALGCSAGGHNGTCTACPDNLMTNTDGADSQNWCSEYMTGCYQCALSLCLKNMWCNVYLFGCLCHSVVLPCITGEGSYCSIINDK